MPYSSEPRPKNLQRHSVTPSGSQGITPVGLSFLAQLNAIRRPLFVLTSRRVAGDSRSSKRGRRPGFKH